MATLRESRCDDRPQGALHAALPAGLPAGCQIFLKLALALASLSFAFGVARAESRGLVGVRTAAATSSSAPTSPAIASAVSLENGADRAKLMFELTQPVAATAFALATPDRIIVDLPQVDFHVDPQAGSAKRGQSKASELISSFRFGLFAPGKSRIVIDLAEPAEVVRAETEPAAAGAKTHLVIELAKTDRTAFLKSAQSAMQTQNSDANETKSTTPAASENNSGQNSDQLLVVVDPGHGGVDSGAIVNNVVEKNVVFDFAKMLADKLRASGHYKVVMTRDSDVFLSLAERVKIARDSGAALFVSIHADTISDAASVSGATVYTASDRASDAEAERTAEHENQADASAGIEGEDQSNGVSDILSDLTRQETRAYSHVFARTFVNYWKVAARLNRNPERAAGFRVLMAPDVPSVLIELGYLSNKQDAAALVSTTWRDATSSKLARAIDAYFIARGSHFAATSAPEAPAATALAIPPDNK